MVPLCTFISLCFYAGISQKGRRNYLNLYYPYEAAAACGSLCSSALHLYSTSITCLHPSVGRDPALTGPRRTLSLLRMHICWSVDRNAVTLIMKRGHGTTEKVQIQDPLYPEPFDCQQQRSRR